MDYGPKVITRDLEFYLDASNKTSYPGSGTSYYNLMDNDIVGNLQNGTSFSNDHSGIMVFDGTDDYINFPSFTEISGASEFTISFWSNLSQAKGYVFWRSLMFLVQAQSNGFYRIRFHLDNDYRASYSVQYSLNTWENICITWNGIDTVVYKNAEVQLTSTDDSAFSQVSDNSDILEIGRRSTDYLSGSLGPMKFYRKALSQQEIYINFNSLRGRFGI